MIAGLSLTDVWVRLGGGELRQMRGRAFWRGGDGWNVALDPENRRWFDHARGNGGGVLALVQTALNCDRRSALAWLEGEGLIESKRLTNEERREHAQKRGVVARAARQLEHWRVALDAELTALKVSATERGDFEELERTARYCHVIENGSPETLVREFILQRRIDRRDVARLVKAGREMEEEARWLAAVVVSQMASRHFSGVHGGS
jgi:hypothetical protein